ncbi:hypothetical protein IU405_04715 [Polaribacter sp. BAL334]|uniref:hypothetical protein n=1 Tax=Polaribacter sp. BAL334 TaxID=1708178 RepID=UPI0018D246D6|nr:hypothetical protein [Polaribacter sp. BAL334]MBG7611548.1 hypothetical protein [Polaribacter sp. BAL334]
MKTIIETKQLEFDKSTFLIDLVRHENGSLYVEMLQNIFDSKEEKNLIKINPTVLTDIIKVLQNYHAKIHNNTEVNHKHITDTEQQKIQERYLKGVSIKDLAMQFDQSEALIEMVLRNNGIEIVENKLPKTNHKKQFYRKEK